jgi:hypothetical protein
MTVGVFFPKLLAFPKALARSWGEMCTAAMPLVTAPIPRRSLSGDGKPPGSALDAVKWAELRTMSGEGRRQSALVMKMADRWIEQNPWRDGQWHRPAALRGQAGAGRSSGSKLPC